MTKVMTGGLRVRKCCLLFTSATYIQVHKLDLFMEANPMKPNQTAPLGAV